MSQTGTLFIVGTPIGNIEDITIRALRILTTVEVIVCEDTRVTSKLLEQFRINSNFPASPAGGQFPISKKIERPLLVRLDEYTQMRMIPKVINWLETGTSVALVTDAGMPTISDPGWKVVDTVRDYGCPVEVIPGPTALTTALAASGMDTSKVWFGGFLPKKVGKRADTFAEIMRQLTTETSTAAVIYESPQRLRDTLIELQATSGKLQLAACGELTKLHEKVIRGNVEEVISKLPVEVKGEWVLVMGKA